MNEDEAMYAVLKDYGFCGLEIAPTRLFPEAPYSHLEAAATLSNRLKMQYGLSIPSMQSIWFGQNERIFENETSQMKLIAYTKEAIAFASAIKCPSLVFGNPKQRNRLSGDLDNIESFFLTIADLAKESGITISLEANPAIYDTNLFNTTEEVINFAEALNHPALKVNIDVGTMIVNDECASMLRGHAAIIQHVHISEPYLAPIQPRQLHRTLIDLLCGEGYSGYFSIEMKAHDDVLKSIAYLQALSL
jgi:sugar phosphate isomerase/epimerase